MILETIGYEVDHLISIELWLKLQGRLRLLQEAAQRKLDKPMTYAAAEQLVEKVQEKDVVAIGTGFIVQPDMVCETDGPIGAAALARAVKVALNATPLVFTESDNVEIVAAACKGLGLSVKRRIEEGNLSNLIRRDIEKKMKKTDLKEAIISIYTKLVEHLITNKLYF